MSAEEKTTSNINCTDADVVLIVLVVFLGFFVYNLIKCYLPKWRAKLNEEPRVANIESSVKEPTQIEFSSTASA